MLLFAEHAAGLKCQPYRSKEGCRILNNIYNDNKSAHAYIFITNKITPCLPNSTKPNHYEKLKSSPTTCLSYGFLQIEPDKQVFSNPCFYSRLCLPVVRQSG